MKGNAATQKLVEVLEREDEAMTHSISATRFREVTADGNLVASPQIHPG